MANRIFLLIAFCFFQKLNAQPYQSIFGSTSAAWKIAAINLDVTISDSLFTISDTTFNSHVYTKINSSYFSNTAGYLREDSLNSIGYFFSNLEGIEKEIYNLNLTLGDSFYFYGAYPITPGWHYVDSVYIQSGKKHIRFDVFTYWSEKFEFIESVGTNITLDYQSPSIRANPFLLCNYHDNIINYVNSNANFDGCNFPSGIQEISNVFENPYPNPTNNFIQLHLYKHTLVQISDRMGIKIFSEEFPAQILRLPLINIVNTQQGIYYLTLVTENNSHTYKIIYFNK